jgi:hypothetical protein
MCVSGFMPKAFSIVGLNHMLKAFSMSSTPVFLSMVLLQWVTLAPTMAGKKKHPLLVKLGREGGKKSAKARMEKLTPEQRTEIARRAAQARWSRELDASSHKK